MGDPEKAVNKWFIGIKRRPKEAEDLFNMGGFQIIPSREKEYYADPFLIEDDGKTYLFFERYDYKKGNIAFMQIYLSKFGETPSVMFSEPKDILIEPWHMSFPSVIKHRGQFYMTPERCLAGSLWIYKATRFPDIWTQHRLVATGRFDDPIIRIFDNKVQVWATEENKLVVWEAGSLDSENWRVIKREDKPCMRNAGHFIGDLRPTQDCVPTYGRAMKIMDGDNVVRSIEPTWYPDLTGTHTFNVSENYVVVDGRIKLE